MGGWLHAGVVAAGGTIRTKHVAPVRNVPAHGGAWLAACRSPYHSGGATNSHVPLGESVTLPTSGGVVTATAVRLPPAPPETFWNRLWGGRYWGGVVMYE